jgi:hypothetical protein
MTEFAQLRERNAARNGAEVGLDPTISKASTHTSNNGTQR